MHGTALWVDGFICLPLSPVVSQPGCLARLFWWTGSFVSLCLPSSVSHCQGPLSPSPDAWRGSLSPLVSLHLSPDLSPFVWVVFCRLPAWMPGTALWVDGLTRLPLSLQFPLAGRFICLPLSADSFVSLCLPFVFVSQPEFLCLCLLSGWTDCVPARSREPCQKPC